jgi:NADPH-dependent curcumin reductase CurA
MPGLTAYAALTRVAEVKPGDAVLVSAAAGAVGSAFGQMARLCGAGRVIGGAGSAQKVRALTERYGFDAAFNYKDGTVGEQLARIAPEGVDVYLDTVGGSQLEAVIDHLNIGGTVVIAGAITASNTDEPVAGPRNFGQVLAKRLRVQGLIVLDHDDLNAEFLDRVNGWLSAGQLRYDESLVTGIENMVDALLGLFRGDDIGKVIITTRPA